MAEPLTPEELHDLFRSMSPMHQPGNCRFCDAARAAPLDVLEWLGPCCTHPTPGCVVCGFQPEPEDTRRG